MEIEIQPPNDVYETFGRLNYKPWHAIAEFVDNSTQSFFAFEDTLKAAGGGEALLSISIDYDHSKPSLVVRDDAHGMNAEEFNRALRLSVPPPDTTGRSEFGMGLKTAACWFGQYWELTSTRLGEDVEYHAVMDLKQLSKTKARTLLVEERPADPMAHGTTLRIMPLRKRIYGRAIERITNTLASMYRLDIATGRVRIFWGDELLQYEEPLLHEEELPDGDIRTWRSPIDITVNDPSTGERHEVSGWVGILRKMSNTYNGFSLLRRGRVILGGPDENWRPMEVMSGVGSHAWKRLVGELHLDTFPVNFSKDGFDWSSGLEEELIDELKRAVADYRTKASNLRVLGKKASPKDFDRAAEELQEKVTSVGRELTKELRKLETPVRSHQDRTTDPEERQRMVAGARGPTELKVDTPTGPLIAKLYLREDDPRVEWLTLSFAQPDEVDVFLNTQHPFVAANTASDASIAMLSKVALALALAEKRARMLEEEKIHADDLRTLLDTFLKHFA